MSFSSSLSSHSSVPYLSHPPVGGGGVGTISIVHRCKTCIQLIFAGGDGEDIWGSIQRSSSYDPRIAPGTPGTYLRNDLNFNQPANRHVDFLRLTSAWFPQSESSMLCYELVLHGSWKGERTATNRIGQQLLWRIVKYLQRWFLLLSLYFSFLSGII